MRQLYLAGPIWGVPDPETWRVRVAADLPEGWKALDPLNIERYNAQSGDYRRLVDGDLEAIIKCAALLALVDIASWGTGMEIRFAYTWGIPVFGWCPRKPEMRHSPWLLYHCQMISADYAIIKAQLRKVKANAA